MSEEVQSNHFDDQEYNEELAAVIDQVNDLMIATPWLTDELIINRYPDHAEPLRRLLPALRP